MSTTNRPFEDIYMRSRSAKRFKDLHRPPPSNNHELPETRRTPDAKFIVSKWVSGSSECRTEVGSEDKITETPELDRSDEKDGNIFDIDDLISTFSSCKVDDVDKNNSPPQPDSSLKRLRETAWLATQSMLPTRLHRIREEHELTGYEHLAESDPFFKRDKKEKRHSIGNYESDVSSPDSMVLCKPVDTPSESLKLNSNMLDMFNNTYQQNESPPVGGLELLDRIVDRVERLEMAQSVYTNKMPVSTDNTPLQVCSKCESRKRLDSKYKDLKKLHKARVKLCDTLTSAIDVMRDKVSLLESENRRLLIENKKYLDISMRAEETSSIGNSKSENRDIRNCNKVKDNICSNTNRDNICSNTNSDNICSNMATDKWVSDGTTGSTCAVTSTVSSNVIDSNTGMSYIERISELGRSNVTDLIKIKSTDSNNHKIKSTDSNNHSYSDKRIGHPARNAQGISPDWNKSNMPNIPSTQIRHGGNSRDKETIAQGGNSRDRETIAHPQCRNSRDNETIAHSQEGNSRDIETIAHSQCGNSRDIETIARSQCGNSRDIETIARSHRTPQRRHHRYKGVDGGRGYEYKSLDSRDSVNVRHVENKLEPIPRNNTHDPLRLISKGDRVYIHNNNIVHHAPKPPQMPKPIDYTKLDTRLEYKIDHKKSNLTREGAQLDGHTSYTPLGKNYDIYTEQYDIKRQSTSETKRADKYGGHESANKYTGNEYTSNKYTGHESVDIYRDAVRTSTDPHPIGKCEKKIKNHMSNRNTSLNNRGSVYRSVHDVNNTGKHQYNNCSSNSYYSDIDKYSVNPLIHMTK